MPTIRALKPPALTRDLKRLMVPEKAITILRCALLWMADGNVSHAESVLNRLRVSEIVEIYQLTRGGEISSGLVGLIGFHHEDVDITPRMCTFHMTLALPNRPHPSEVAGPWVQTHCASPEEEAAEQGKADD